MTPCLQLSHFPKTEGSYQPLTSLYSRVSTSLYVSFMQGILSKEVLPAGLGDVVTVDSVVGNAKGVTSTSTTSDTSKETMKQKQDCSNAEKHIKNYCFFHKYIFQLKKKKSKNFLS